MKNFSLLRLQARSWYRLTLILCALTFAYGNAQGAAGDVIKEFNCSVSGTNQTTYGRYTPSCDDITWNISCGQTSYIGIGKAKNYSTLKITNSTDLNAGKAVNSSITTSSEGYVAVIPQSTMTNVGKIIVSCSAISGTAPEVYVVSSTALSSAYSKITLKSGTGLSAQGATMSTSGLTFEFDKKTTATYYAVVFYQTEYYRLSSVDIQLIEGAASTPTPSCSNKITVTKVDPENGSFF